VGMFVQQARVEHSQIHEYHQHSTVVFGTQQFVRLDSYPITHTFQCKKIPWFWRTWLLQAVKQMALSNTGFFSGIV
jgi:hypothetical protein